MTAISERNAKPPATAGTGSDGARATWGRNTDAAPIVAAVELETADATADAAAKLAGEFGAPLIFVTVRPRPPAVLGNPYYQRRLTRDLFRSRKALDAALAAATRHGVMSYGEILEGRAASEILEFAAARKARLLVVGARRRRFMPSVSRRVIGSSARPVVVAAPLVRAA